MTVLNGPLAWLLIFLSSSLSILLIVGLIYALSYLLSGVAWLLQRLHRA